MAAIETTYGNGGVQTNTQGLPLTSGGDLNSVLAELVRRRLQTQAAPMAQPRMMAPMQRTVQHEAPPPMMAPVKSSLQRAQERDAIIRLREAEQGPPLRYSGSGFNLPQRLEMDDQHMSAYQRQMYLPQAAGMREGGADTQSDQEDLMRLAAQLRGLGGR